MYKIIGVAPIGFKEEIIDEADTKAEALQLVKKYKFYFGNNWRIFIINAV